MMDLIAQDKKVKRGQLTFILVRGIGRGFRDARRRGRRGPRPSSLKSSAPRPAHGERPMSGDNWFRF